MSEGKFRLLIGIWRVLALVAMLPYAIYALMGVLLFEGMTNLRVPMLISRLRYGTAHSAVEDPPGECKTSFEAERVLRFILIALLAMTLFMAPELLWWLPWFIAFALIGAGLSGICPMISALRWAGTR